jgi:hypothetical protein
MTSEDEKRGLAPRARNKTVVLSSDLAGRVRASVKSAEGVAADGDDGFFRPGQGSDHSKGQASNPVNNEVEGGGGPGRSSLHSRPEYQPVDQSSRTINPNSGIGAAQVRAVVQQRSVAGANPVAPKASQGGHGSLHGRTSMVRPSSMMPLDHGASESKGGRGGADEADRHNSLGSESNANIASTPHGTKYGAHSAMPTSNLQPATSLLLGFLVSFDKNPYGDAYEIREGRTIISSDLPMSGGMVLLIDDPSVQSMHAVIKGEGDGTIILLDQLSESGSFVRSLDGEEKQLCGDRASIKHGDMIRFGARLFKVCLL